MKERIKHIFSYAVVIKDYTKRIFRVARPVGVIVGYGLIGALITLVIIGVLGYAVVANYRGEIFSYFASGLIEQNEENPMTDEVDISTDQNINQKDEILKNVLSELSTRDNAIVNTVEKVDPAVVAIVVTKDVPILELYSSPLDPFGILNLPKYKQNGTRKQEVGGGSGFFVSSDGLIVTNRHVVADSSASYTVFTNDGEQYPATIVAQDAVLDVALIKVKTQKTYPYLTFGNSDELKLGQTVIAIGNALGEFRNSVSVGVVSGLSRSITAGDSSGATEQLDEVIQTDAAINPGNSGGPLLNIYGKVVGVNVAVAVGSENVGFSLPANAVKKIVESVKATGEIVRPYVGVRYVQINDVLRQTNNLTVSYGLLVTRGKTSSDLAVMPGSPADKAGIVENDIVLEANGIKLDGTRSFASIVRSKQVGDILILMILHNGVEVIKSLILEKAPKTP